MPLPSVPDYCRTKKCREKEQCVVKDNAGICVATSKATCRVIGDPNYETFDGSKFSFQGTCSYIMVNTSGEDKSLTEFTIINKNELAHSGLGAYIKTVIIKFRGHEIIIAQNARDKVIVSKTHNNDFCLCRIRQKPMGVKTTFFPRYNPQLHFCTCTYLRVLLVPLYSTIKVDSFLSIFSQGDDRWLFTSYLKSWDLRNSCNVPGL